jgi:hypothetical protein
MRAAIHVIPAKAAARRIGIPGSRHGWEIPAFAGMTKNPAGMTGNSAAVSEKPVGVTGNLVEMNGKRGWHDAWRRHFHAK